jgi:hypothetical protein
VSDRGNAVRQFFNAAEKDPTMIKVGRRPDSVVCVCVKCVCDGGGGGRRGGEHM